MPMVTEQEGAPSLATSRTIIGPKSVHGGKSIGDMAVNDAIIMIVVAWAVVFVLAWTLRNHNV